MKYIYICLFSPPPCACVCVCQRSRPNCVQNHFCIEKILEDPKLINVVKTEPGISNTKPPVYSVSAGKREEPYSSMARAKSRLFNSFLYECSLRSTCQSEYMALQRHWTHWCEWGEKEIVIPLRYAGPMLCPPSYAGISLADWKKDLRRPLPEKLDYFEKRISRTALHMDQYGKILLIKM